MASLSQESFSINIKILTKFRYFSPENSTIFSKLQVYACFVLFTLPIPIFGSLYFVFNKNITQQDIIDNAFLTAQMSSQVVKVWCFIRNGERIQKCVLSLDTITTNLTKEGREVVKKYTWICRRNSLIFLAAIIGGNIFWSTRPIVLQQKKLPVEIWVPFDVHKNWFIFSTIYTLLALCVCFVSMSAAAIDPLVGGLPCVAAGQFELLKYNLENITQILQTKNPVLIREFIITSINHHKAILQFVYEYEKCISMAEFSQFLGSIVVMCFCCLQLTKVDPLSYNFYLMLGFIGIFLTQIYLCCYYGTILYEKSNTLIDAVFKSKWYNLDKECKMLLIILMERSKRPVMVTAGKLLDLSVGTFTTILKRSYSLLAVVNNM